MLFLDVFRVSTRSFKNNRLRTGLTVLGVSIGIGAIFFLVSLGYGFQKLILEKIASSDSILSLDVTNGESGTVKLTDARVEELKKIDGVVLASPVAIQEGQIIKDKFITDSRINFLDNNFLKLDGITVKAGRVFNSGAKEVVLTSATMKLLEIPEDNFSGQKVSLVIEKQKISDGAEKREAKDSSLDLESQEYEIVGVLDDESSSAAFIPLDSVNWSFSGYEKVKIKVASESILDSVRSKIIEEGYYVSAVSDIVEQAKQIFKVAQIILVLFGIVALVVSAIGMFNTMTIALLERTVEIGIMKSLGASSFDIWKLFLAESMLIGFFGGVFGVGVGFGGGKLINFGINQLAKNFGGMEVDLFYTPVWFVLFILGFSTLVGFITGFYPARRAAKLNPLEALRYK